MRLRDWAREILWSPSWTPKMTKATPSTFFPYKNLRGKRVSDAPLPKGMLSAYSLLLQLPCTLTWFSPHLSLPLASFPDPHLAVMVTVTPFWLSI